MRHILQEIFERYLNTEQAAFDTTPRELWPGERLVLRPPAPRSGNSGGHRSLPPNGKN